MCSDHNNTLIHHHLPHHQFPTTLPTHLCDVLHKTTNQFGTRIALQEKNMAITYQTLEQYIEHYAKILQNIGVCANMRIMIISENSIAQVILIFAIWRLNAWCVIVNSRLSAKEIDQIACHAQAFLNICIGSRAQHYAQHIDAKRTFPGVLNEFDQITYRLNHAFQDQFPEIPTQACAALIYTTGTTGQPKGVMLSHQNLIFAGLISGQSKKISEQDSLYLVLPIAHVFGLTSVCLSGLFFGARLVIDAHFDEARTYQTLMHENITVFQAVPTIHGRLLNFLRTHQHTLHQSQLRFISSGGAPLSLALKLAAESIYGQTLHNGYGMTEASPSIAQTRANTHRTDCSVGPPIPYIEIMLLDQNGTAVHSEEIGEIWVRGANIMLGYYRDLAQTKEVITQDGWLKTGDLARRLPDGAIEIMGRKKEMIIRSGLNIYPVEIENILKQHPVILEAAVVGYATIDNEEVIAYVQAQSPLSENELLNWCKTHLSHFKVPQRFIFIDQFPCAISGKILKHQLHSLYLFNHSSQLHQQ